MIYKNKSFLNKFFWGFFSSIFSKSFVSCFTIYVCFLILYKNLNYLMIYLISMELFTINFLTIFLFSLKNKDFSLMVFSFILVASEAAMGLSLAASSSLFHGNKSQTKKWEGF